MFTSAEGYALLYHSPCPCLHFHNTRSRNLYPLTIFYCQDYSVVFHSSFEVKNHRVNIAINPCVYVVLSDILTNWHPDVFVFVAVAGFWPKESDVDWQTQANDPSSTCRHHFLPLYWCNVACIGETEDGQSGANKNF